ncbi:PGDH dehydrogenase, partial [Acromyrmex charruanus]
MYDIKNKTVMITGAAAGLGYKYAEILLRNGAKNVAVVDLPTSNGQNAVATLENEFGKSRAIFVVCDVTKADDFEKTFKKIVDTFKGLDILINNAGIFNDNYWEKTIDLNVKAVIRGSMLAFDYMGKHKGGKGGLIVNVASVAGLDPVSLMPMYCASKYAVLGFSQSLANLYNKTGVRVVDKLPSLLHSNVVYKINCQNCDASYVDKTERLLKTRINKHRNHRFLYKDSVYCDSLKNYTSINAKVHVSINIMYDIKNKTVMITGAAAGLGYKYAEILLRNGVKSVAVVDLPTSNGQNAVATLENKFGKGCAIFVACDVTKADDFEKIFKKIIDTFKGLDILINNAGIFNDIYWEKTIDVNVKAVIRGSMLAFDYMGKHKGGKGGLIVNVASVVGLEPNPYLAMYCASKYAIVGFSRSLANIYNKTEVRVVIMCPGVTGTALVEDFRDRINDSIRVALGSDIPELEKMPNQTTDHVALAMLNLIQKGKNGAAWVVKDNESPCTMDFPPYFERLLPI